MLHALRLIVTHDLLEYRYMDDGFFVLFNIARCFLKCFVRLFRLKQEIALKKVKQELFTKKKNGETETKRVLKT